MGLIRRAVRKIIKLVKGGPPDRYPNLYRLIEKNRCRKIMEIGTWNGEHALLMIQAAQKSFDDDDVEYYGFDLFEMMSEDKMKKEYAKSPPSMGEVKDRLTQNGARVKLFKGDTNAVLGKALRKLPKMDFIFIDGGHSIETIANDWKNSSKLMHNKTIVVFDDYFRNEEPEVRDVGCQHLIDKMDKDVYEVEFLEPECHYKKNWGTLNTRMVKVTKRQKQ